MYIKMGAIYDNMNMFPGAVSRETFRDNLSRM